MESTPAEQRSTSACYRFRAAGVQCFTRLGNGQIRLEDFAIQHRDRFAASSREREECRADRRRILSTIRRSTVTKRLFANSRHQNDDAFGFSVLISDEPGYIFRDDVDILIGFLRC